MTQARAIGDGLLWQGRGHPPAGFNGQLPSLIAALGSSSFYRALANSLATIAGVEHLHVFLMEDSQPAVIASISHDGGRLADQQFDNYMRRGLWRHDTTLQQLGAVDESAPLLLWTDAAGVPSRELREHWDQEQFAERLLLYKREGSVGVALTAVRVGKDRPFGAEQIDRLAAASEIVLPMLARNVSLCRQRDDVLAALTSLSVIETVMRQAPVHLPPREQQTGARLLYGLSAGSIAVDLGVSVETVTSFRKRLYQRLSIGCHRELLLWYLRAYNALEDASRA